MGTLSKRIMENLSKVNLDCYQKSYGTVDFVIGGGGFFGYYLLGIDRIIKKLENHNQIHIERFAGTSVGSISCVFMVCGADTSTMLELYKNIKNRKDYFDLLSSELDRLLPEDAHRRCTGRVFISISYWTLIGLQNIVISEFHTKKDLIEACLASSCLPFLVTNRLFYRFRGMYCLDGVLTKNLAYFKDKKNRQILIKLNRVTYDKYLMMSPSDDSIESLVVKGAIDFDTFLRGEKHNFSSIEWYNPKKGYIKNKGIFLFVGSISLIVLARLLSKHNT